MFYVNLRHNMQALRFQDVFISIYVETSNDVTYVWRKFMSKVNFSILTEIFGSRYTEHNDGSHGYVARVVQEIWHF